MAGLADRGRAVIVIPAYEPTSTLLTLVDDLCGDVDRSIVVVDDGSSEACRPIFSALQARPGVVVLRHAVNIGKGQALKTAFNHFLLYAGPDAPGVVTADADGQHLADDLRRVADHIEQQPSTLVLGSRSFAGKVPFRSRIGNACTRAVFHALLGQLLADTQTACAGFRERFAGARRDRGRSMSSSSKCLCGLRPIVCRSTKCPLRRFTAATRLHFSPLRDRSASISSSFDFSGCRSRRPAST